MNELQSIGTTPFDMNVLQSVFPDCRHTTDKAIRLEAEGEIIRLKKGLCDTKELEIRSNDYFL